MTDFATYLYSLPTSPLIEAVKALYEPIGTLRKPTKEELEVLVPMASETEHRMRGDWDSNKDAIIAEDNEFIEQVSNGVFQAVTDGNGIVIYGPYDGRMYVYLLFVRPECRRTGTARRLMEYVKSQAGGMPIALSVNNHNDAARALYKKLGMTDGKTFGYDGYDIIEMQSPINESLTSNTMWLRHAYHNIGEAEPNPATPRFNEAWHKSHPYESAGIAFDALIYSPSLAWHIVKRANLDGLILDMSKYEKYHDFEDLEEPELVALVEDFPEVATQVIGTSEAYGESDAYTFSFKNTTVNGWLVHNSNYGWDIWSDGFKYGDDIGSLAYSNAGSISGKEYGDYLFAYPIDEAPDPDHRGHLAYGDISIVFVGTGNTFYHNGDTENQVIFDRREPTGCFVVEREEYHNEDGYSIYWCVFGKNHRRPLYHSEEYRDCLNWISKNGYDFRSQMKMWNNATPGRQVEHERRIK